MKSDYFEWYKKYDSAGYSIIEDKDSQSALEFYEDFMLIHLQETLECCSDKIEKKIYKNYIKEVKLLIKKIKEENNMEIKVGDAVRFKSKFEMERMGASAEDSYGYGGSIKFVHGVYGNILSIKNSKGNIRLIDSKYVDSIDALVSKAPHKEEKVVVEKSKKFHKPEDVERIYVNREKKTVSITFKDGTKTKATKQDGKKFDEWDVFSTFSIAYAKKFCNMSYFVSKIEKNVKGKQKKDRFDF